MLIEKRDTERFLSVLAPSFKGVYFVNMQTDTLRKIYIPVYFQNLLNQTGEKYQEALRLYQQTYVAEKDKDLFTEILEYDKLDKLLEDKGVHEISYEKKDGEKIRLSIIRLEYFAQNEEETLWIFSKV